jgi:hypothetical protein
VLALLLHGLLWLTGTPFPQLNSELVVAPIAAGSLLALGAFMTRTAAAAFDDFKPALASPADEEAERRRLLTTPDRAFLAAGLAIVVLTTTLYAVLLKPTIGPRPPSVEIAVAVGWLIFSFVVGMVIAQTVTQLRSVRHLSAIARNIDVLDTGPVDALSRVTAVGAVGLLTFITITNLVLPSSAPGFVALDVLLIVFAALAFLLPLQVMHRRLGRQKSELLGASAARMRSVLDALHRAVDSGDYTSADALNKMVATALAERDLLTRLPTWPWTTTTIRGVGSALLLPVAIFVITRGIDRLTGP